MSRWFILKILAVFGVTFTFAQVSVIRVASNLVLTPVWVADITGKSVRSLTLTDFEIEENGIRVVPASLGEPGEAPLEVAMLFDLSGSVHKRFDLERQAASKFLQRIMRPCDSAFIVSVANEPKILQERTSLLEVALQAVARIAPTSQATAFYTSVIKAAQMLADSNRQDARHVVVALSDGEDNRSIGNGQAEVLNALQVADALFYAINPNGLSYGRDYFGRRAQQSMETLASQTGGATFVVDSVAELVSFYDRIADELQGQYLLGYYSPTTSGIGVYRKIQIRVHGRPELQVKARPGYFPR